MGIPFKQYLYGAVVFATVLIVLLNAWVFQTSDTAMQEFCALTLYFSFLAWAGGQIWLIHIRERQQPVKPAGDGSDASLSAEFPLEEAALRSAETYLSLGERIDTVCAMVEPRFADWSPAERASFRESLMTMVQERRTKAQEEGESAGA
jgi:hypothetical protein